MKIKIPKLSLVVLIGASGSGKSTFARKHFLPTEIVSSDACRGMVCDDENSQAATPAAFELVHFIIEQRLKLGKLTVVDATNVQPAARKKLIEIARRYHALPVAIALKVPESVCQERNRDRPDRQFGSHVVRNQVNEMRKGLGMLRKEGFRHMFYVEHDEVDTVEITREPLYNDRTDLKGPFDIIGDVHGCFEELVALLSALGYHVDRGSLAVTPPEGRTALFLGDLVDRGPDSPSVLRLVMGMVAAGTALCVPGNHDIKFHRYLTGSNVSMTHGLDRTVEQFEKEPDEFRSQVATFIDKLVSHYVLDDGRLVVAHAGLPESMQGRGSGAVRQFALYGETTGETDEFGLPVRYKWARDYRGEALVVYGHTPVVEPDWLNNTVCIDTGCVFGGKLTAMRYPERELVSVPAAEVYSEPIRPLDITGGLSSQHEADDLLDISDVKGRMHVRTRLGGTIVVAEEQSSAALEVMSRFAANPKWLVYLPPTMSPCETSGLDGFLEHPVEAFRYYELQGVQQVMCQEKHMGSRSVLVLCRSEAVARDRFGVEGEGIGVVTTRTGRPFFTDKSLEQAMLRQVDAAMDASGLWEELQTEWVVLDAELMPWSAKAQGLLKSQYAPVGIAGRQATAVLDEAFSRVADPDFAAEAERARFRRDSLERYVEAYRRYCWPAETLADFRLAPFHVMATEGKVHWDKSHGWHMDVIGRLCDAANQLLFRTKTLEVEVGDPVSVQAGVDWWLSMTESGGEGMVVKPAEFLPERTKGFIQPAVKVRGREYLRIIYGPEYLEPNTLQSLKKRGLGRKRNLASREFALGLEALERFVRCEPLRAVHQCVFAVLALESEPVDPRL